VSGRAGPLVASVAPERCLSGAVGDDFGSVLCAGGCGSRSDRVEVECVGVCNAPRRSSRGRRTGRSWSAASPASFGLTLSGPVRRHDAERAGRGLALICRSMPWVRWGFSIRLRIVLRGSDWWGSHLPRAPGPAARRLRLRLLPAVWWCSTAASSCCAASVAGPVVSACSLCAARAFSSSPGTDPFSTSGMSLSGRLVTAGASCRAGRASTPAAARRLKLGRTGLEIPAGLIASSAAQEAITGLISRSGCRVARLGPRALVGSADWAAGLVGVRRAVRLICASRCRRTGFRPEPAI
jgi:hypothetical protein